MIKKFLMWLFKLRHDEWEYGTIRSGTVARRSVNSGEVQIELWKRGEQGHTDGCWHKTGLGWDKSFHPFPRGRK